MNTRFLPTASAIVLALAAGSAQASVSIPDNFKVTGPVESLTSYFTDSSTLTANSFSNYVGIHVSGTGWAGGSEINDAFYMVATQTPFIWPFDQSKTAVYQLNMAKEGDVLLSGDNNIQNYMTFIDGVGHVPAWTRPAYSATNTYDFVVNVGSAAKLQLGVYDGVFGDNGGQYDITVSQLAPVPEPEEYVMMLLGFGMIGYQIKRKKS
ncbi:MAG: PEP-CTERM sorting domain-containing protein [Candidatus Methylumidiphilus sp.]